MWPDLFGPGWPWGVLAACGILTACVALVSAFGRAGRPDAEFETFQELWRRYEQGDLTRWEFERLRPARAASHMFDRPAPLTRYPRGLPSIRVPADAGPGLSSQGGA